VSARIVANPLRDAAFRAEPADQDVAAFHRRMPGYAPTPLVDAPAIAGALGVARVLVKAETERLGLPSFKILGASWATYRALCDHRGAEPEPWSDLDELAERLAPMRPFALAAATDGNHGRAVAHMARRLGFAARIFVPEGTATARVEAIEGEGATVTVVDGDYDDAVARSAGEAGERCLVISDTSWPGYDVTPRRVIEGYSTIFAEIDAQVAGLGVAAPGVVVVPVGVGAFMAAAVAHHRSGAGGPVLVGVEPTSANCVQASVEAGQPVVVPGPHRSIMAGLNCGTPSPVAWPAVAAGVDWFVAVDDDAAETAMRDLAAAGVVAGETGAAALAGLGALAADVEARRAGGLGADATVVVMVSEGATDPANYRRIVGRDPAEVGGPDR